MTKFILSAATAFGALLGTVAPAMAAATEQPLSFERDGVHYVATVRTAGAATFISGNEVETGKRFELRYQNGRVAGQYGLASVNTTVAPRAK